MDTTIVEHYTLPSLGKVYNVTVNPDVAVRSMTVTEEMKRLGNSDKPLLLLCEIIDACLLTNPGISSYDMCLADYQFLLHKVRIATYGSSYKIKTTCPYCGITTDDTINLTDMVVSEFTDDVLNYLSFELPNSKKYITLKMQTPRMMDQVTSQTKEANKRKGSTQEDSAFLYTLLNLVDTIDGNKYDIVQKEKWIRQLSMLDARYILDQADKFAGSMGIRTDLIIECDACGLAYKSPFRTTSEFFRPTFD